MMRILMVVHGFPPQGSGGAELYAAAHARALVATYGDDVAVLAREAVSDAPEYRIRDERRDGLHIRWINNTFRRTTRFEETYDNPAIRKLAAHFIDEFRPDVAHVHHLTCLSTTILDELAARGVPIVLTLHDYWMICHRGQLLDLDLQRCAGPGSNGCARCTGAAGAVPPALAATVRVARVLERKMPAISEPLHAAALRAMGLSCSEERARESTRTRLEHMHRRWKHVSAALAPSRHTRERFVAAGFPADVIHHSEYGVDPQPFSVIARRAATGVLRLGFLGSVSVSKAPHVILDALRCLPPSRATLDIFGETISYHGDDSYARALAPRLHQPGVTVHGAVPHHDVPRALAQMDVLVFPSVWEETSGIAIREALLSGAPVIASRIGAIPETVRDGVNGLLFEPGQAADLARAIRRLLDEPRLVRQLQAGIETFRTLADDVRDTRVLYDRLIMHRACVAEPARPRRLNRLAAVVLNYRTPDRTRLAVEFLRMSKRAPDRFIVVDNDSGDDCRRALESVQSDVRLVQTGSNLGFSGGMNAGIRAALDDGADAVLLVNSDVVVPPDCLATLEAALLADPSVGIVGPVICSSAAPDVIASRGLQYRAATGRLRHRAIGSRWTKSAADRPEQVDAVSGCLILVRREVFQRVGLLDEAYYFSFEEVELCLLAREAGFKTELITSAVAYHEGGRTIGAQSPRRLYFATRNHLRLAQRIPAPDSRIPALARAGIILSLNLAHAVRATGSSLPIRLAAVIRGAIHHARGRYGADGHD